MTVQALKKTANPASKAGGGCLHPSRPAEGTAKRGERPPFASGTPGASVETAPAPTFFTNVKEDTLSGSANPHSAIRTPQSPAARLRPAGKGPGRRWRAYQLKADKSKRLLGIFILLWRRQSGKTEVLSTWALETMLACPGETVILASASLNVGGEVAIRAAKVFWDVLERLRARFKALHAEAHEEGKAPQLLADFEALKEAFVAGKLEVRFVHPGGKVSRLKVLAPNPATARGFSGTVFLDEIGFIRDFRALWDAVEPITSSDPTFRLIMCTTPPADAGHYCHEMIVPPAGMDFETVEPEGVWYRSEAGIMVHRVDAWDADAAGAQLYHPETRAVLTPDEHRALALDKEAWDRNYGLRLASTGTAACALNALNTAQTRPEAKRCHFLEGELPAGWRERLGEISGPVGVGFDVATTEKNTSNPSSITLNEPVGSLDLARLIFRWKTDDPKVSRAYLREILSAVKPARLCIDGSNERFFAKQIAEEFSVFCPVEIIVSGETIREGMEEMDTKTFLGSKLVNALDDGRLALPADRAVRTDFRLVRKVAGRFDAEVDGSGNHADTFDSTKLALHASHGRFGGGVFARNIS